MFTGIVEEIGIVVAIDKRLTGVYLKIETNSIGSEARLGDSIAIDGVCLSIVFIKDRVVGFDVIHETVKRTTLGQLEINDAVNLEKAMRFDSRIGGHFVTGHVDYKGRVEEVLKGPDGSGFEISLPDGFSRFVAEKGSIAVDGVSLTVANISKNIFTVYLIPHTLKVTTFSKKKKGDFVNVETDLIAKYLVRQTPKTDLSRLLQKYDYI